MNNYIKFLVCFVFLFQSCQKDEELPEEKLPAEEVPVEILKPAEIELSLSEKSKNRLKNVSIIKEDVGDIRNVKVVDLFAMLEDEDKKGLYLKFNLEKAEIVTGDDWDIAFYSRSIVVNGGLYATTAPYSTPEPYRTGNAGLAIMGKLPYKDEINPDNLVPISEYTDGAYLETSEVPKNLEFIQDKRDEFAIDDNSKGMFDYFNAPPGLEHVVSIKKNRFLIIRTHNGHYAKLKIKTLYKEEGKTANSATTMNEAISEYFGFYTFTYNYNKIKGDFKLIINTNEKNYIMYFGTIVIIIIL